MSEWQPMETAPMNRVILVFSGAPNDYVIPAVHRDDGSWDVMTDHYGGPLYGARPTHWMPLPEPPK